MIRADVFDQLADLDLGFPPADMTLNSKKPSTHPAKNAVEGHQNPIHQEEI